jgi:hypothetical protein
MMVDVEYRERFSDTLRHAALMELRSERGRGLIRRFTLNEPGTF